jgi:hypothetical protein
LVFSALGQQLHIQQPWPLQYPLLRSDNSLKHEWSSNLCALRRIPTWFHGFHYGQNWQKRPRKTTSHSYSTR